MIQPGRKRSIVRLVSCPRTRHNVLSQGSNVESSALASKVSVRRSSEVVQYASFFATHIYCSRNNWAKTRHTTCTEIFWLEIYLKYHIWIPPASVPELNLKIYVRTTSMNTLEYSRCTLSIACAGAWTPLESSRLRHFPACTRLNTLDYSSCTWHGLAPWLNI